MAPALKQAGALLALVVLSLGPGVLSGQVFFQRDVHLMWYTQAVTLAEAVRHARWPVWNPYIAYGQPLWADANTQPLYPFTLLHLVVPPWTWYVLYVVAHLWLAGVGTAVLARRLGMSAAGALLAGSLVTLSGPVLSLVPSWNQLAGAAWMPWTAACALAALRRPSRARIAALAGCLAAPVLAGSPEGLLMGIALTVACVWGRFGRARILPRVFIDPRSRQAAATTAAAVVLASALSAGQWLPALDAARRSARATLGDDARAHWSVTPALLGQTVLPVPLGTLPLSAEARFRVFGGRDTFLASLYLGLPALALLAGPVSRRRRRLRVALLAAGLLALLLALGPLTPLYHWAVTLPGLSALRYPAKAMALVALCWGLLAGLGLDGWVLEGRRPGRRPLIAAGACLGVALAAAAAVWSLAEARPEAWTRMLSVGPGGTLRSALLPAVRALTLLAAACLAMALAFGAGARKLPWAPLALGLVPALDLLAAHYGLNPTAPIALYTHRPALLDAMGAAVGGRVLAYDYFQPGRSERHLGRAVPYLPTRGPQGWSLPAIQALALRQYLFPPVAGAWKAHGSFDQDVSGFGTAEVARLSAAVYAAERDPYVLLRLLQVGAVTHVVALHEREGPLVPAVSLEGLFPEPMHLYRVPHPLPRVYLAQARASRRGAELGELLDPAFDPARDVLVEDHRNPTSVTGGGSGVAARAPRGSAHLVEVSADTLKIEVEAAEAAHLVVVDAFDPHWTATVDGAAVALQRANTAFRAVAVGPGRHEVVMRYRPWPVFAGVGLSLAALVVAATLVASRARRSSPR